MSIYRIETDDGSIYDIEVEEAPTASPAAPAPSVETVPEMVAKAPDRLGRVAGVAGMNAPDVLTMAQGMVPGGSPQSLVSGALGLLQQPDQLKQAAKRGIRAYSDSAALSEKEKTGARIGQTAAALTTMVQPGLGGTKVGGVLEDVASSADDAIKAQGSKFKYLIENPFELFQAPSKRQVKSAYQAATKAGEESLDDMSQMTAKELAKAQGKSTGKLIQDAADILDDPKAAASQLSSSTLIKGRKALDQEIKSVKRQIETGETTGKTVSLLKDKLAKKFELRERINKALDAVAPKTREADKAAARQLSVDPFRTLHPIRAVQGLAGSAVGAVRQATLPITGLTYAPFRNLKLDNRP